MSRDANQESKGLPRKERVDSQFSDFEDSVLQQVLQLEPPPQLPGPGEHFGGPEGHRYEVLEQVGSGAMGQVFRARDGMLHREVALKFLAPRSGLAEEALREARAVARLDHENIVRIFDVSEWSATPGGARVPFLVMEYLEGESLAALLRRHRPGLKQALDILGAVAEGLTHAHERHLIHRDLKPSNIFLTRQGTVKLLDFGLCHWVAASGPDAPHLPTAGTPAYMAPEQWRGEPQDTRTDIWAAGVVLFEMLTGALPFPTTSVDAVREWVTSAEPMPSVRTSRPDLPHEVELLLATALAKDPARRFPSALELREELRELQERLLETGHEAPHATPHQRRQVTLVSCVLTRLDGPGAGTPPAAEDPGEWEAAFHQACARAFRGHGGFVPLSLGDEVLACFGWYQVREDDSERAVRAGLEVVRSIGAALPGMAVKVGIHTDMVALDERASGQRCGEIIIRGQAPKVAAWLARQARPGEVLLGEATWKGVRGTFEATALGPRTFEGLSGSLSLGLHRVSREREGVVRFERALAAAGGLTPLVGRSAELGWLLTLWEWARQGQGAFVLVSGEAGIGKSRLIRELGERIPMESATRVRFQCWARPVTTTAHHPLQGLIEALFQLPPRAHQGPRELAKRLGALGASAERVQLIELLLGLPVAQDSPVHQLTPERRKEKAFEALVDLTLHMARERPVLVFVEDLHWADSSLLEFLSFLLDRIEQARVLVVFSTRPELRLGWARRPWLHLLALDRLPAEQAAALVRETARGRELPEDTVQALVKRTDGIPLFIREMTHMVLEGGAAASIPVTLHELLLARLDMLPSRQKALLQLCAVVGRDFTQGLLAALPERDEATLRRELAGLVEADFLREEEGPEPTYQFRQALIQEVALQSLTRGARRQHHRNVARVLEEQFPEVVAARPEVLAYHHAEAGEPAWALPYQFQAGQFASQRSALREAVSHYTRALELLRSLPHAERLIHEELRILLALGLPLTHLRGYRTTEVERTYARARKLLHRVGDALPELELSLLGPFTYYQARCEFRQGHELAGSLVELGERHHDRVLLILGHRMRALNFVAWGQMREALRSLENAMACARFELEQHRRIAARHGTDPWTTALAYAALIHSVLGHPEEARRYTRGALEMAAHIGHAQTTAYVLTYVAMGSQYRHEPKPTLAWADQLHALANERSFWIWGSWATVLEGWARAQLDQPREGLALIRQELASWKERGIRYGVPYCLGLLAEIHLGLGQLGEGLAAVHEAQTEQHATGERTFEAELYRVEGELLHAMGRERKAKSRFIHAIETAHKQDAGIFELRATVGLCRMLRDLGRLELARQLLQRARTQFGEHLDSPDHREASSLMKELMRDANQEARV
ncbi:protein kinase domain-containing protein [Archangium lansingense]|uniref:Protein kinase n=1 Tax=Archangium lansingense TaxID=2995310 RepID=A0ABT4AA90_9BACT|nr:protein kinase [Archangium lansinium]MCY1078569.1 protein kinase [Archangium lansinium]